MENTTRQLQKLEGVVEHTIYENAETGYAVFEVDAGGQDVVVAGNVGGIDNGMHVTVYGRMVTPAMANSSAPNPARPACRRTKAAF